MANQPEVSNFDIGVYQLQTTDPVQGGVGGVSNAPLLNLANRTKYLYDQINNILTGGTVPSGLATINSPSFTGSPTAPTGATGDNSTLIATNAFVQTAVNGLLNISVAGYYNLVLTAAQAGVGILVFSGALTSNVSVIVPNTTNKWTVSNITTGNYTLTVKTAGGSGITVSQGKTNNLFCDGANVGQQFNDFGTVASANTAGTVTNPAQPNITSLGNLTSLNLNGIFTQTVSLTANPQNLDAEQIWEIFNTTNIGGLCFANGDNRILTLALNTDNHLTLRAVSQFDIVTSQLNVSGSIFANNGATITNNYLYQDFNSNPSGPIYPVLGNNFALGGNFTAGQKEVDFWNANSQATTSFNWYQLTASNASSLLMSLSTNGLQIQGKITADGSGLTGTASSLSIGGNAATATTASGLGPEAYHDTPSAPLNFMLQSNGAGAGIYMVPSNNYATATGVNASGTWNISVNGSAGTVTTGAQPNITSVGTLTSLAVTGNITSNGTITGANVGITSDERLKENWRNVDKNFIEKLAHLKAGLYDLKTSKQSMIGVGAQSLQEFLKEGVIEGEDGYLSVAYGNVALVASVELAKEVRRLNRRLEALENMFLN